MSSTRVVLASDNAGKLAEFSAILEPANLVMHPQGHFGITAVDEPHVTFVENALLKARHASRESGMPALADDSGLCVSALNDAPGVYSARYAALAGREKSDAANNAYLLERLDGMTDRRARYVAVLVFVRFADDPLPIIAQGVWHGEIATQGRGDNGFGYDPYFYLPELDKTVAELDPRQKNALSHRGRALRALLEQLDAGKGRL
ncbi:MAG TPA: RdgB/HAM1 family non-canonical purine NTP pyrophosphatase [Burkholderiaceae bacterium]|nr:RdgB/HAM1 family non-canonical purine NTP pyrophosphatase [Burkholderiaceae bacterium]